MLDRSDNEGNQIKWWQVWVFAILFTLMFSLSSCGAKEKVVSKSKTVENRDLVIQKSDSISTDIRIKKILENITIEPVDPTLPNNIKIMTRYDTIVVEGSNTRLNRALKKVDSLAEVVQKMEEDITDKSIIETKVVAKQKESNGFPWNKLILALSIGGFIVIGANVAIWLRKRNG